MKLLGGTDTTNKACGRFWLGALLVLLLTGAAHYGGLSGRFLQWDDTTHVTQNVAIRALTIENVRLMFTTFIAKLYLPLTWLSFAVDHAIWGRDPFGYHLTNLLLHLANTLLVFGLVNELYRWRTGAARPAAAAEALPVAILTAAIFGVHPLRVESVAWVTERKDVLFAFFYLLGLLVYTRWAARGSKAGCGATLGLFVLAALAKSTALTFPVVLLLLDEFVFHRRRLAEKIPFFAGSVLIGLATLAAQAGGSGETVLPTAVIPLGARVGLVGYCALFYVRKFFWPFHLSAIYPTFEEMNWHPLESVVWLLALAAVTAVVVALRRRVPLLLPAWLFYLITLAPTIGLIPVGVHVVADRFSYLPSIALALVVSAGLVALARRAWPAALVIPLGLMLLSQQRTAVWHDTETLFTSVLAEQPESYPALVNLTRWYTSLGRTNEAIAVGERAVASAPAGLIGRHNLAVALIKARRYREAVRVLRPAIEHGVDDLPVWQQLHECFVALGDTKNARVAATRVRELAPAAAGPDVVAPDLLTPPPPAPPR